MKNIILVLTIFTTFKAIAQSNLKTLHTVVKSELSKEAQIKFCISESNADSNICLMTRARASEYCQQRGLRLPTAKDFAIMAQSYGADVGSESCIQSNHCQKISPIGEAGFFYNSQAANIRDILPEYWYHTLSLREIGANFQFDSDSGYMGSSSDQNPGNVACIKL